MEKLLALKEWISLEEASNYLSTALSEEITVADIYKLALNGHLVLSVNFPNQAKALLAKSIPYKDVEKIPDFLGETVTLGIPANCNEKFNHDGSPVDENAPYLSFGQSKIYTIEGVWDLAMIGNEAIDVQWHLQRMIGGPEINLTNLDGTFLKRGSLYASLRTRFENEEDKFITIWQLYNAFTKIFDHANISDEGLYILFKSLFHGEDKTLKDTYAKFKSIFLDKAITTKERFSLFGSILKDESVSKKLKKHVAEYDDPCRLYPAGGLPQDAQFVLRAEELQRFIDEATKTEETRLPFNSRERNNLLKLIAALMMVLKHKNGANMSQVDIIKFIHEQGYRDMEGLSQRQIEKVFGEANKIFSGENIT